MIRSINITLENVDWNELREHKKALIDLSGKDGLSDPQYDAIEGLLCFIDHIQDQAFETGEFEEEDIYIQCGNLSESDNMPKHNPCNVASPNIASNQD